MSVVFQTAKLLMKYRRRMLGMLGRGAEWLGHGVQLVGGWVGRILAVCAVWSREAGARGGQVAEWVGERLGDGFAALARWTEDASGWVGRGLGRAGRRLRRRRGQVQEQEQDMV